MEENKKNKGLVIGIICMIIMLVANIGLMITTLVVNGAFDKESKKDGMEVSAEVDNTVYSANEMADLMEGARDKAYQEGYEDLKVVLKDKIMDTDSANIALRDIYTDSIVYIYENEYVFLPVNKELPLNTFNKESFVINDKDLPTYTIDYRDEESGVDGYQGIDVSKFQGQIDWEKVASSGIEFSFVRVGYRGYETGKIVEDETAKYNIEESLKNGIKTGVYFYTQAITKEEAVEEAKFVIDIIKDYDINYPVAFDLEVVEDELARTNELTKEERIAIVKAFCDTIKEAGYTPMLYGNLATMFSMVDYEETLDYDKWYAYYDIDLYYPYDLAIWQYSCTGKVDGIEGECDLNLAFKDLSTK